MTSQWLDRILDVNAEPRGENSAAPYAYWEVDNERVDG